MFFKLAKFEFNYFSKQPSFYVTLLVFFLLPFFAMISTNVQIGGASNVNFNSPHAITQTLLIMSTIGMFLVANFVGGTAVRDTSYKMDGIILSTPLQKSSYLWGRLLGSFLVCLTVFLFVPLGTLIGTFWPTIDAERLGDTQLLPYVCAYLIFIIPNFLFCSALFYIFALKARSMMGMYLGVVGFFILYETSQSLFVDPEYVNLAAMLDPFGMGAFAEVTRYWTPYERNTQLITLEGNLLANRVLWFSISLITIALTHFLVNTRKPTTIKSKKQKQDKTQAPTLFNLTKPNTEKSVDWKRFIAQTKFELLQIIKSAPFIILCVMSTFMLSSIFINPNGSYGTANWPLTRDMADYIRGSFSIMIFIVMTYYSGETVWRERQFGIGEIVESTSIKNWSLYFPKVIALSSIILCLSIIGVFFSALYQAGKSYDNFEWSVYIGILSLEFILPMTLLTILAVFIQVLSPNKYAGMLIFVAYFILTIVARNLGMEHNLWRFGRAPAIVYSDINQYGHYLEAVFWYNVYWIGFTSALVVLGYALWSRGTEYGLKYRFSMLRSNMGGFGSLSMILGLLAFIGAGSNIYYNTRVLNDFYSEDELFDQAAAYEKKYKQYQSWQVPTITDIYADVDFYPKERKVQVKGHYLLKNTNKKPLKKVLVTWAGGKHRKLSLSADGVNEVERDEAFSSTWILFEPALDPGDTRRMDFEFIRANQGFVDQNSDTRLVANGSFVNNSEIFPHFGYAASKEIIDRHERRKRELPEPERMPKLEDESQYETNYITGKEADFINFETVVSTTEDQFAISPGYLQKDWIENGRHYFHYKMDAPILSFVSFLSGSYEAVKEDYKGISLEVYHQPDHHMNVQRMLESIKDSLDYFGEQFSPYQHRQVRIIEFPRYAAFAQSYPNTIPYSEDVGFIADLRDPNDIDYVYFVTAHEMAHQWWAHQVIGANVQGGTVLSETLAEYSAYMLMEKTYGKHQLRKFLKWEMDRYLIGRGNEVLEEMPLYRVEDQQYIHYRKGGVVMYSLRDRLGEEALNGALRKFLEKFQYASTPYPTTLDLIEFIKAEASPADHGFIDDMFTKITIYDLKAQSAIATKLDNGKYQLEITLDAHKFYADGQGEETETTLEDSFDIGIFSQNPDYGDGIDQVLYFKKHSVVKGQNVVTVEVDGLPQFAGIDPYIKMIDRNSNDNLIRVELK